MTPAHLEPLSDEVLRLLAKERDYPPESAGLRNRVMARARGALQDAPALPSRQRWRGRPAWLLAAALVCALAGMSFAAWQVLHPAATPTSGADSVADPAVTPTARPANPQHEATDPEQLNVVEPEAPGKVGGRVAPRRPSADDAYGRELAVLQRARAAVAKGAFTVALEAIAEHQRRFPAGKLQEEREALRVRALSGLGRNDEAQRAAAQFRERFPGSVLSPRIEETVRQTR